MQTSKKILAENSAMTLNYLFYLFTSTFISVDHSREVSLPEIKRIFVMQRPDLQHPYKVIVIAIPLTPSSVKQKEMAIISKLLA
ncbi:MAG: hypothetical protein MK289_04460 [Trichodesmium sp. ALOHA_ZT_67]|nr:hypothetical protein [Trichodesmium sp. ALOHA_ZT_67]